MGASRQAPSIVKNIKRKKKMKIGWFRRKFNSWVRRAWDDNSTEDYGDKIESVVDSRSVNSKSSVSFVVHLAEGGHIIEYYRHNRFKDSDGPNLVIVPTGESLETAMAHALTMASLRT